MPSNHAFAALPSPPSSNCLASAVMPALAKPFYNMRRQWRTEFPNLNITQQHTEIHPRWFPPNGTLASDRPLQQHSQHLQPWNGGNLSKSQKTRCVVSIHRTQDLVHCWLRWFPTWAFTHEKSLPLKITLYFWWYIPPRPSYWLEMIIDVLGVLQTPMK